MPNIKINEKILSIPPYISTIWSQVAAIHMKGSLLVITLNDGNAINIPALQPETIELIFNYHATFLEKENQTSNILQQASFVKPDQISSLIDQGESSVRLAFGSLDGLNTAMQHNPAQANAPDLPNELLHKISAITKIIGPADEISLPKAEPHCNCFHCQIARAIHANNPALSISEEGHEEVSDIELQFQQWNIIQTGDKLFSVTNRLDTQEKYSVYLGQPVGCTCGKQGCEHILAVLKS